MHSANTRLTLSALTGGVFHSVGGEGGRCINVLASGYTAGCIHTHSSNHRTAIGRRISELEYGDCVTRLTSMYKYVYLTEDVDYLVLYLRTVYGVISTSFTSYFGYKRR